MPIQQIPNSLGLLDIPCEIQLGILDYLDPISSLMLGLTNKYYYGLHWEKHGPIGLDIHFCKTCSWKGLYPIRHNNLELSDGDDGPFYPFCLDIKPGKSHLKFSDVYNNMRKPPGILPKEGLQKCRTCRRYKPNTDESWNMETLDRLFLNGWWPAEVCETIICFPLATGRPDQDVIANQNIYKGANTSISNPLRFMSHEERDLAFSLPMRGAPGYHTPVDYVLTDNNGSSKPTCRRCKALILVEEFHSPSYINRIFDSDWPLGGQEGEEFCDTAQARGNKDTVFQLRDRQDFGQVESGAWSQEIGEVMQQYDRRLHNYREYLSDLGIADMIMKVGCPPDHQQWMVGHSTLVDERALFKLLGI